MKEQAAIEMDFARARAASNKLEEMASAYIRIIKTNEDIKEELISRWKDENSNLFMSKYNYIDEKLMNYAKQLKRVAETVNKIAENVYRTEMEALEVIE